MHFCFILEQFDMLLLSVIYHVDCEHAISFCSAMLFVSMLWNSAMEQNMSLVIFLLPCFCPALEHCRQSSASLSLGYYLCNIFYICDTIYLVSLLSYSLFNVFWLIFQFHYIARSFMHIIIRVF